MSRREIAPRPESEVMTLKEIPPWKRYKRDRKANGLSLFFEDDERKKVEEEEASDLQKKLALSLPLFSCHDLLSASRRVL